MKNCLNISSKQYLHKNTLNKYFKHIEVLTGKKYNLEGGH